MLPRSPHAPRLRLLAALCAAVLTCLAFAAAFGDLPPPDALVTRSSPGSTKILDRHGHLLYEVLEPRDGRRTRVGLSDLPAHLIQAVLAVEDAKFYRHPGVDVAGVARSLLQALQAGHSVSGGSTITQQLARDLLLSDAERQSRSLLRKAREMVLALRLTAAYDRDTILTMYLNEVYFGQLAYGVEAAARTYFGRPAAELDLAESALLAGLIQSPFTYNPLVHQDAARARQSTVLTLMEKNGFVTAEQAGAARDEELHFATSTPATTIRAPHFVAYVRSLLEERYGPEAANGGGLVVTTTLDLDLQRQAESAVARQLAALQRRGSDGSGPDHNVHDAALVALDPASGQILAMVGSADYFDESIDGAVNVALARRQPGSAIKPITYAAALAQGLTPATVIADVPRTFVTEEGMAYTPENYDRTWHGPISLRAALATSSNMVAVRVLDRIGLPAMLETARYLGITSFSEQDRHGLALTLGGGEVTLLELTAAYSALANSGRPAQPMAILAVRRADGSTLGVPGPAGPPPRGISEQVAFLITDILADDAARMPAFGASGPLSLSRPAAAKTGTTTDFRDNWTVGYAPQLAAGVWVGNADNEPMFGTSGVTGAAPIWHDLMESALAGEPVIRFSRPNGIVEAEVCESSGLLATPECLRRRHEIFLAGTEPLAADDTYRRLLVDGATGLLWTERCSGPRAERVYRIVDLEIAEWARGQGIPQPPTAYCDGSGSVTASVRSSEAAHPILLISYPDADSRFAISTQIPPDQQLIELAAWASSDIVRLRMELDRAVLRDFEGPPFRTLWPLSLGTHALSIVGWDESGRTVRGTAITFTVEATEVTARR